MGVGCGIRDADLEETTCNRILCVASRVRT